MTEHCPVCGGTRDYPWHRHSRLAWHPPVTRHGSHDLDDVELCTATNPDGTPFHSQPERGDESLHDLSPQADGWKPSLTPVEEAWRDADTLYVRSDGKRCYPFTTGFPCADKECPDRDTLCPKMADTDPVGDAVERMTDERLAQLSDMTYPVTQDACLVEGRQEVLAALQAERTALAASQRENERLRDAARSSSTLWYEHPQAISPSGRYFDQTRLICSDCGKLKSDGHTGGCIVAPLEKLAYPKLAALERGE